MKPLRAVFIGDLHLNGPCSAFIEDYNRKVLEEVRLVIQDAVRDGITHVFLLGDLFDSEVVSAEDYIPLVQAIKTWGDVRVWIIGGNHDTDAEHEGQVHSLNLLKAMLAAFEVHDVHVSTNEILDLWDNGPYPPVRLLPWPMNETRADALNVMHLDVKGSHMDSGRESGAEFTTKHLCVSGHLHTSQRVRNVYYPGTLFQVTFGERPEKFYLKVKWTGDQQTSKIERIPWKPAWRLETRKVSSSEQLTELLAELEQAPADSLYSVYVNTRSFLPPAGVFDKFPCVVRTNPFRTEEELAAMVHVDYIENRSATSTISVTDALSEWLAVKEVGEDLSQRAFAELERLTSKIRGTS